MNIEDFREFCLSLPQVEEKAPFTTPRYSNLITFTVAGKWFTLLDLERKFCNLKAIPSTITAMQEQYAAAFPAWHMNKNHWLSIQLDSDMPDAQIRQLLTTAYDLIIASLPKSRRPLPS